MYAGQYVFSQVMDHLPWHVFRRCVDRYGGDHKIKRFSCLDQFRCFAFAQLTWRESLRDIEVCLHWRIYADFAQHLIGVARELYVDERLPDLAQSSKLYHLGFRSPRITRNTMSNANAV